MTETMTIEVTPLTRHIGGRMTGIDARKPLTPDEVDAIDAGMDRYAVLVLPGQDITDAQQLAFTRNFGPLEEGANSTARAAGAAPRPGLRRRLQPRQGRPHAGARQQAAAWRRSATGCGTPTPRSASCRPSYSILSGRIVTTDGGNTEFADMRAAYDALDAATKAEIEDLICEHSLIYSRGQLGFTSFLPDERVAMKPVRHRLVRTHPTSGRKSLFLSAHIGTIVGWPRPEAMAFIRDLMEHATQPQFVYSHRWTQHDLVIWDNRATMHRVRRFDDLNIVRDMRRTTTRSDGPTVAQEAA